jgi:molybdopterin converting factor small subunit
VITVLFFGPVADAAGSRRLEIAFAPGMRLQDLRGQLQSLFPQAFELVSLAAVDGRQVRDSSQILTDGSEVVFMSKFSGG